MLVILEGPDGVGKDTAAVSLMERLRIEHDLTSYIAPEPSKDSLGRVFRDLVLCPSKDVKTSPLLDALVMMAARRENYERFIPKLLSEYDVVIVTRNWMSLEAYQLWDIDHKSKDLLYRLNMDLLDDIDVGCETVQCLLYCEFEIAFDRMSKRGDRDRIEQRGEDYMRQVNVTYAGFIGHPDIHVVDAKQTKSQVSKDIYTVVLNTLRSDKQ